MRAHVVQAPGPGVSLPPPHSHGPSVSHPEPLAQVRTGSILWASATCKFCLAKAVLCFVSSPCPATASWLKIPTSRW